MINEISTPQSPQRTTWPASPPRPETMTHDKVRRQPQWPFLLRPPAMSDSILARPLSLHLINRGLFTAVAGLGRAGRRTRPKTGRRGANGARCAESRLLPLLMSPLTSTIVAPAPDLIADDLDITEPTERIMVVSIFVLGFVFGPLVASLLSEVYSAARTLCSRGTCSSSAFNTACGGTPSAPALLVLRFLAGLLLARHAGYRRWHPR